MPTRPAFATPNSVLTVSTFTPANPSINPSHLPLNLLKRPCRHAIVAVAPPPEDSNDQKGLLSSARDFLAGIRRATGLSSDLDDLFDVSRDTLFENDDQPPTVLVAGATGETGRIIVRKLVLRGYRVRVLVRDLYSSTLDLLGTGVQFVKGTLDDYDSLLEATGDVDKVVCAVGTRNVEEAEMVEYEGIARLIRAFQDSRVQFYGRSEATKLILFNFGDEAHLKKWKRVIPENGEEGAKAPRVNFQMTGPNRVAFMGHIYSRYSGKAEVRTVPAKLNLRGFSGLVLRCIGDGKNYCIVLRTSEGVRQEVEYCAEIKSHKNKWATTRIPLSSFRAYGIVDHKLRRDATELDREDVRQIAIQYRKPEVSPEKDDGRYYLGVDYMKAYRTQEQPDFALISCASVTARDFSELDEKGLRAIAKDDVAAWKYMTENRLRQSGLTYCIVRPGTFTDQPGGNKAITLDQDGDVSGAISRADLAEVCVKSLLDPRACNVTFDAFESMYAPSARTPSQDVSAMLGNLQPNT